jgi:uncharacterized Tic20 family protein
MKVTDELLASLSYAGVIVLGPVVPLLVYLGARHRSQFVRQHAAQALNVALTWLLYGVSGAIVGALLALSTIRAALLVMIPLAVIGWLVMATYLVLAATVASQGGFRQLPAWVCSSLVKPR